jgi:hypothetical protein
MDGERPKIDCAEGYIVPNLTTRERISHYVDENWS